MPFRPTPSFVLAAMTVAVTTPWFSKRHGRGRRFAYITPQQWALLMTVGRGYQGTHRDLAPRIGYTIGGLNDATASLVALGALGKSTVRGRLGSTRLWRKQGVQAVNPPADDVNVRVRGISVEGITNTYNPSSSVREHLAAAPPDTRCVDPPAAWRALRTTLFAR
jgi:hypothetical protein